MCKRTVEIREGECTQPDQDTTAVVMTIESLGRCLLDANF